MEKTERVGLEGLLSDMASSLESLYRNLLDMIDYRDNKIEELESRIDEFENAQIEREEGEEDGPE